MQATVTTTSAQVLPGSNYGNGLILQNQNTDADLFLGWGDGLSPATVSAAGATDAGIMLARAASSTQPTTLILMGEGARSLIAQPLFAIHNGSGGKPLTIQVIH